MSPRDVSAPMSCCRMPFSMFSVLPLREFCWLNRRSPPPPPSCLLFSHPTYALVTAKWSLPPPAWSEKKCLAALPLSRDPSVDTTNGLRYAAAHATVNTGSKTPRSVAYSSIFPTLGCTGISPRCLPNFVKLSSSFSAPMFCRSVTACTMACGTGGSGACARNAAVDPAPLPTVAATPVCSLPREETSANIRTCKQSSSSGDRCISGSWKSANAAILLDE
mmetsp:Transcript_13901/g.52096  ORF Transcript_13901/g.52096 Transcript_13901/m.52096 type:complete len:220 (+) Transcript_13901:1215-1874(+)